LIIDAMDLLYTRNFDGFCLVTSDSDFTGLAMRIREEGLTVLGFGEQKTPAAFKNSCHKFIFTEVLRPELQKVISVNKQKSKTISDSASNAESEVIKKIKPSFPKKFILDALEQSSDEEGWAQLGTFGSYLTKLQPDFDSRNFGFKKLSDLVKAKTNLFIIDHRETPGSSLKQLYIKAK